MSKHMVKKQAICPYYKHEDIQQIYCDGTEEGQVIHVAFANRTEAKEYKAERCYGEYIKCPVARMLEEHNA